MWCVWVQHTRKKSTCALGLCASILFAHDGDTVGIVPSGRRVQSNVAVTHEPPDGAQALTLAAHKVRVDLLVLGELVDVGVLA